MKMRTNTQAEGVFDEYFFEKNLQGDIVAVYNSNGTKIGTYTYDAWGNFTITLTEDITPADEAVVNTYNPFRYRGYYYDVETGLYYLQSRYYNPQWGRFINADGYVSTGQGLLGNNMFAYCNNNPVSGVDPTGERTYSIGLGCSAFLLGGSSYSYTWSIDTYGNVALQKTRATVFKNGEGGTFGLASIGASITVSTTELDTVNDLNGKGLNCGFLAPVWGLISVGKDNILDPDNLRDIIGNSVSVSAGLGLDAHIMATQTEPVFQYNLFDTTKAIIHTFLNWLNERS